MPDVWSHPPMPPVPLVPPWPPTPPAPPARPLATEPGAVGVHFCLGALVARTQLRAILRELLSRLADTEDGKPRLLAGCFVHAVRSMPCIFTA